MKHILQKFIILVLLLSGCGPSDTVVKHQTTRDNIIDVKSLINVVDFDDYLFSRHSRPYVYDKYLFVVDYTPDNNIFHIFDLNTFEHLSSFGNLGQGPGEFVSIGPLIYDTKQREITISEFSKHIIYSYNIENLVNNPNVMPVEKLSLGDKFFPSEYQKVNDSIYCGIFVNIVDEKSFTQCAGIWNQNTDNMRILDNKSVLDGGKFVLAVSVDEQLFAECSMGSDHINIFDFDGNLLYDIIGPDESDSRYHYYAWSIFTNDYLVALYNGHLANEKPISDRLLVFDKNGDYLATLQLGYSAKIMCYDETNNRLFVWFDDDIQLGWIDFNKLSL